MLRIIQIDGSPGADAGDAQGRLTHDFRFRARQASVTPDGESLDIDSAPPIQRALDTEAVGPG
jgi:hypothetical protein